MSFAKKRKEACEALHPETKHETFKGNEHTGRRKVCDNQPERFTTDTAASTGRSERSIQLYAGTAAVEAVEAVGRSAECLRATSLFMAPGGGVSSLSAEAATAGVGGKTIL
jgi:hypothetical protein